MKMADQDIPELKRDALGKGVRGKYLKHFVHGSKVVVLHPGIQKAFAQETQGLRGRSGQTTRKRVAT